MKWPYHDEEEIAAVAEVLRSGKTNYWSEDSQGQNFEKEFAAYTGARHALTVTNGTTALELALSWVRDAWNCSRAEVIVPCRTFMATASAVVTNGMLPKLADIDPQTLNVTVDTLEACRTRNTAAVIVVHYAGLPCDMSAIIKWAAKHNIIVIEDCAHAHGAKINGRHVGTFGDVGTFSFCVGKTMSTGGEGGMVITDRSSLYERMAARRDHGRFQIMGGKDMTQFQWTVEEFGTNLRMTEMQSAIGRLQLKKMDAWVDRRNAIAAEYDNKLTYGGEVPPGYRHGRYMYVVQTVDRDRIMRELIARGVPARIGGCWNIGHERAFGGTADACPNADAVGHLTLALPVYPTMTDEEVENVVFHVKQVTGQ